MEAFLTLCGVLPVAKAGRQRSLHRRLMVKAQNRLPHTDVFRQLLIGIQHQILRIYLPGPAFSSRQHIRQTVRLQLRQRQRRIRAVRRCFVRLSHFGLENRAVHLLRSRRRTALPGKQLPYRHEHSLDVHIPIQRR